MDGSLNAKDGLGKVIPGVVGAEEGQSGHLKFPLQLVVFVADLHRRVDVIGELRHDVAGERDVTGLDPHTCGPRDVDRRHHIGPDGYYRGRKVMRTKDD